MSLGGLLKNHCVVYRKSESATESTYGNPQFILSVLYASVPCNLQEDSGSWKDERIPGSNARRLAVLYCPYLAIKEDNVIFVNSELWTVAKYQTACGMGHHLELVIERNEPNT